MDVKDYIVLGVALVLFVIWVIAHKKGKTELKELVVRLAGMAVIAWVVIAVIGRIG